MISESTRNLMEERVQAAIVKDEERRLQEEKKQEEEQGLENNGLGDDEEELNSADDVSEYEEDIDPGRNILLAYFKKVSIAPIFLKFQLNGFLTLVVVQ